MTGPELKAMREQVEQKPPGRPQEMSGGKRVQVYLDDDSVSAASKIGDGNVSNGIRKALKMASE